ncbi:hypothetical protein RintRC_4470 [Richelia intracellularis]|nr:hypothetical protein RintRC_4470 [Richelia intracellularis]
MGSICSLSFVVTITTRRLKLEFSGSEELFWALHKCGMN